MPRIQGLFEEGILNENKLIKAVEGYVFSITVAWKGAAVGDIVAYLLDGITDVSGTPSTHRVVVIAATANGIWSREWSQGKKFDTGIYYKEGVAANVFTELTAK